MSDRGSRPSEPPELTDAIQPQIGFQKSIPSSACQKLLDLALHGHKDFTWGSRIYRTTYTGPNSDEDFERAIDVLDEYMRYECFSYYEGERDLADLGKPADGKANHHLWQRLNN